MLKFAVPVRRRAGVTHEELAEHWLGPHRRGVAEYMRPDHYRVTIFDQREGTPYDGMATLWFEDAERGRHVLGRGAPEPVRRDGFVELVETPFEQLECVEHVVVEGPRPEGALKLVGLVRRRPEVAPDTLYREWLEVHAPNVAGALEATAGAHRYAISFATEGRREPAYAGLAELWYDDAAASRAHAEKLAEDGFERFADTVAMLVGREYVGVP